MSTPSAPAGVDRPFLQPRSAFDVPVRKVFRRALEAQSPGIETIGFAGFFGLPLAHTAHGSDIVEAHLPVLLTPGMTTTSHFSDEKEHEARIGARAARAWGRFRQAAVSSFAFVEAAGPLYGAKLVRDALGLGGGKAAQGPAPRVVGGLDAATKAATAAAVLKAMSLTAGHGRVVLLLGHGAQVTNNPHESAYHCGACGGHTGEVSARLLAMLLNDPETRARLPAQGIDLAPDTVFVAGLHDTTTDEVTLYRDGLDPGDTSLEADLAQGAPLARRRRRGRCGPSAHCGSRVQTRTVSHPARRIGPRSAPNGGWRLRRLHRRAPGASRPDRTLRAGRSCTVTTGGPTRGFGTLELILTAPVVVASWISLQYYGSAVAPEVFGGGNKAHTQCRGRHRRRRGQRGPAAPRPALAGGARRRGPLAHEPLRLSVYVEAPRAAIADVLAAHDGVRAPLQQWLAAPLRAEGRSGRSALPARPHLGRHRATLQAA